jgi:hypothetical protein
MTGKVTIINGPVGSHCRVAGEDVKSRDIPFTELDYGGLCLVALQHGVFSEQTEIKSKGPQGWASQEDEIMSRNKTKVAIALCLCVLSMYVVATASLFFYLFHLDPTHQLTFEQSFCDTLWNTQDE